MPRVRCIFSFTLACVQNKYDISHGKNPEGSFLQKSVGKRTRIGCDILTVEYG